MSVKKNPEEIYKLIIKKLSIEPDTICTLKKPCSLINNCTSIQSYKVIDFDYAKMILDKSLKQATIYSSVDALTFTNSYLCFIELKGWRKFLEHQPISNNINASDREKEVLGNRIDKQLRAYDFQKKLIDSIRLCEKITSTENLIQDISIIYILATDIDTSNNPLALFTQELNVLANYSSSWEKVCAERMEKQFLAQVQDVKPQFISCNKVDKYLHNL